MSQNNSNDDTQYEKVCSVCRRTESVAGKMIQLQQDFYICNDCLQKSFDMINNMKRARKRRTIPKRRMRRKRRKKILSRLRFS